MESKNRGQIPSIIGWIMREVRSIDNESLLCFPFQSIRVLDLSNLHTIKYLL